MMQKIDIAIIESQFLVANGLRSMLESMMEWATINTYSYFDEFIRMTDGGKVRHIFVEDRIYAENKDFFSQQGKMVIVLGHNSIVNADGPVRYLDINKGEKELVRSLMAIHDEGHSHGHPINPERSPLSKLSNREIEVLKLIAEGYINKEIADILNISQATVVTHRTNISNKLGIKAIASLAVFAVAHGLVNYSSMMGKNSPE